MTFEMYLQIIIGILSVAATIWAASWSVQKAFRLQKENEEKNKTEYKKRLILGMFAEMKSAYDYLFLHQNHTTDRMVDCSVIFHTVRDQMKLFTNPKLIGELFTLRVEIKRCLTTINNTFEEFLKTGSLKTHNNWSSYNRDARIALEGVRKLLANEYPGPQTDFDQGYLKEWV